METSDCIAISSMVIALSALLATIWQAQLTKKHNRLSVTPNLIVHHNKANKNCIFTLENNGLGPAIIKEFKLVALNKEISGFNEGAYDEALNILGLNVSHSFYYPSKLEHISPMKKIELYELHTKDDGDLNVNASNIIKNLKFKIVYTSIYHDKDYEYFGNT